LSNNIVESGDAARVAQARELALLRLLVNQMMMPRDICASLGLNLSDTLVVIGSLLGKGLVAKKTDGFSGFVSITDQGTGIVNAGK